MNLAESSGFKSIDLDKMVSSMMKEIDAFWSLYDPDGDGANTCAIYRVPEHIREIDRVAYEPTVISFGPYHHEGQRFQIMEKKKWQCLDRVLKLNCEKTLHDYIKAIGKLEIQARKCYSEQITMERKKFVQMLLLDGCFILVNIDQNVGTSVLNTRRKDQKSIRTATDANTSTGEELEFIKVEIVQEKEGIIEEEDTNHPLNMENSYGVGDWLSDPTWDDMFLLENQIPFFVLQKIYELVTGRSNTGVESLRIKTAEFVENLLGHYPIAIQELDRPTHFHHLLHLCHMYLRPWQKLDEELQYQPKRRYFHILRNLWNKMVADGRRKPVDAVNNLEQIDCFQTGKLWRRWRRAVDYHQAGVQFKRREYDGKIRYSLLDIRLVDGVLEIPCLPVDESTESLFKNLLALEQMDPRFGNDFSSYVAFMAQIMDTPADATMFVQRGIIFHMMDSDEEVSGLFTRLSKQVTLRFDWTYYLQSLCNALESHYQSRLNRWIAWLWLNHFVNPWLALATFAAGVVLACTIVQTIYTVLAYVKPPLVN